jgi:hypothetical protein
MENPRILLPILGLTNLGRTILGEKGTKSPVGLQWTWAQFWTINKPLFLAPMLGIGNSNPRAIHLSFWLTLIFVIAYMIAFLFVSLKVGEKLDTRRSRSSQSTPTIWWLHQDSLFSGRFYLLLVSHHPLFSPHPTRAMLNKVCHCVN